MKNDKLPKEAVNKLDMDRINENDESFLDTDRRRILRRKHENRDPKINSIEKNRATQDEFEKITKISLKNGSTLNEEMLISKFNVQRRSIIGDQDVFSQGHNIRQFNK